MTYNKHHWELLQYQEFILKLDSMSEQSYQKFQQGLITSGKYLRGVRTPILKKIAKEVSMGNYIEFLEHVKQDSYEEIILYGLVISYLKIPFAEQLKLLDRFIPMIDNWAINDIVAANLKSFKKNQEEGLRYIKLLLCSKQPWTIRFGLVLLLDHYINEAYICDILEIIPSISNDDYYVKMANAWLISICYIKQKDKTTTFLTTCDIDTWTFNKAISKICDSYQVSKEDKNYLRGLKR